MDNSFLDILNGIFYIILFFGIIFLFKHIETQRKLSRIKWCKDFLTYDHLNDLGFQFIDTKYRFSYEQDKPYVVEIIKRFSYYLQNRFFDNTFPDNKKVQKLSDEEFVMLYLYLYISNMNLKEEILGEKPICYSHEKGHSTIYHLSKSGYAYYRLFNIIESYCKMNEQIKRTGICVFNTENVENVLTYGIYKSYDL